MRVVLDTNILVSFALSPSGRSARILEAWGAGAFDVVTSQTITDEYRAALGYDRVRRRTGLSEAQIETLLRPFLVAQVEPANITPVCRDPKDDQFLAAALGGGADYIVTADEDILALSTYRGIPILTPAAFLAILQTI